MNSTLPVKRSLPPSCQVSKPTGIGAYLRLTLRPVRARQLGM